MDRSLPFEKVLFKHLFVFVCVNDVMKLMTFRSQHCSNATNRLVLHYELQSDMFHNTTTKTCVCVCFRPDTRERAPHDAWSRVSRVRVTAV